MHPYREDARPAAREHEVSAAGLNVLVFLLALLLAPVVCAALLVVVSSLPDAVVESALPWTTAGSCVIVFGIFLVLNATVAGTIRRYFGSPEAPTTPIDEKEIP